MKPEEGAPPFTCNGSRPFLLCVDASASQALVFDYGPWRRGERRDLKYFTDIRSSAALTDKPATGHGARGSRFIHHSHVRGASVLG